MREQFKIKERELSTSCLSCNSTGMSKPSKNSPSSVSQWAVKSPLSPALAASIALGIGALAWMYALKPLAENSRMYRNEQEAEILLLASQKPKPEIVDHFRS